MSATVWNCLKLSDPDISDILGNSDVHAIGQGHTYLGHNVLLHFGAAKDQKVLHLKLVL